MDDRATRAGFDWDRDQEDLLVTPAARPEAWASRKPGIFRMASRAQFGVVALGSILVLGLAYERGVPGQARGASAASSVSLENALPRFDGIAVPGGLIVYDDKQAERFLRDLRLADMHMLHRYIAHMSVDLAMAEDGLRPFYQDAQLLLTTELARRAANVP